MKSMGWIRLVVLALLASAALVSLHGYVQTNTVIQKYVTLCGAYPTLDEAIEADMRHNGFDPAWFEFFIKSQNSRNVPYTWYVAYRDRPEFAGRIQSVPKPDYYCGGSFYEHTRYGWVGTPETFWNALGFMDFWMRVYHLYGGEI